MFEYEKFSLLMKKHNFTIKKLALELQELGVSTSESAIKGYKVGNHTPRLEIICGISKILEVEVKELIKC